MHFHLIFLLPESECNGCPAEYRRAGLPHSYTDLQVYSGNTQRILHVHHLYQAFQFLIFVHRLRRNLQNILIIT